MKCKVFLINLDSSTERFTFMDEQLKQLGIEYQRISAVYGKDLHDTDIAKVYDPQANLQKYDKKLNLGEIGCYLSHVQCWQMIIEQQLDYALILEDDSVLDPALMTVIEHIENLSTDWDYIKLCHDYGTEELWNAWCESLALKSDRWVDGFHVSEVHYTYLTNNNRRVVC